MLEGVEAHGETVARALMMEAEATAYDCTMILTMMAKEDASFELFIDGNDQCIQFMSTYTMLQLRA